MESYGIKSADMPKAAKDPSSVHCFIEPSVRHGIQMGTHKDRRKAVVLSRHAADQIPRLVHPGKGLTGSSAICGQDPGVSDSELDIYGEERGKVSHQRVLSVRHSRTSGMVRLAGHHNVIAIHTCDRRYDSDRSICLI